MAREPAHGLRWKLATVVDILVVVAIGAALIAFLILMFASSSTASRSEQRRMKNSCLAPIFQPRTSWALARW